MRPSARAHGVASSSAWVGCACQPSPALITLALVHWSISRGAPLRSMADDERVDAHRGDRLDRVAQALALVEARLRHGERHRVGRQPLGGRLEAQAGAGRVLEEDAAHGLAAQRRHLRVGAAVDLGHVVGEVEEAHDAVGAEVVDRQQRSCRCVAAASRDHHPVGVGGDLLVGARRQVLADEVGTDRQLAVAAVDEHGELHRSRPAVVATRRRARRGRCVRCRARRRPARRWRRRCRRGGR